MSEFQSGKKLLKRSLIFRRVDTFIQCFKIDHTYFEQFKTLTEYRGLIFLTSQYHPKQMPRLKLPILRFLKNQIYHHIKNERISKW